ncbi:MAG TPA: phage tail tape measure protein [Rhizobiales bacterium]|nr:phage tail tape measure protein [Hyphomicrobiales bacterium]
MPEDTSSLVVNIDADISGLRRELDIATRMGRGFGSAITHAFESAAIKGRNLGDVLRSLAASLASTALRAGMKPLENMLGNAFGSLFSGLGTTRLTPFADGGGVNSPVLFPMGAGQSGVMGEAGAEAIMPLARGADGKLGVRADANAPAMTINFNVQANDPSSFLQSESQISAMLARATRRGTRNL